MWTLGILVLVPYIIFSFSYPYATRVCDYELGTCSFINDLPYQIMRGSLTASYYGWWLLAPAALLCGLADVLIGLTRQIRKA